MLVQVPPAITTFPMVLVAVVLVNAIDPLIVVVPETVKLNPPTFSVEPLAIVTLVQAALAVTVTLSLPSIITLSPAPG